MIDKGVHEIARLSAMAAIKASDISRKEKESIYAICS
jgi:hypothetical protein